MEFKFIYLLNFTLDNFGEGNEDDCEDNDEDDEN